MVTPRDIAGDAEEEEEEPSRREWRRGRKGTRRLGERLEWLKEPEEEEEQWDLGKDLNDWKNQRKKRN